MQIWHNPKQFQTIFKSKLWKFNAPVNLPCTFYGQILEIFCLSRVFKKYRSRRITPFVFFGGGGVAKKSASAAFGGGVHHCTTQNKWNGRGVNWKSLLKSVNTRKIKTSTSTILARLLCKIYEKLCYRLNQSSGYTNELVIHLVATCISGNMYVSWLLAEPCPPAG